MSETGEPFTGDMSRGDMSREEAIPQIISEFSEVFASAKKRLTHFAEGVHPELKSVGMLLLQTIQRRGPITATELVQILDMDKASVSRQLSKLRELGFLLVEPSAEDRRVFLLSLSPEAVSSMEALRAETSRSYEERFKSWSDADILQLRALLKRYNAGREHELASEAHRQREGRCDAPAAG